MFPAVDEAAIESLKFSECLPLSLATQMLERRLQDTVAASRLLQTNVRYCVLD